MKIFFYGFFIALATLFAEAFNNPSVILNPFGYLIYGLLYVFFINSLITKQIKDWKIIYLYGVLVGFITEAYIAKVIFFGWNDASAIFGGFAIFETLFLSLFYHPLISFILPCLIAKNYFNFPFAFEKTKHPKMLFFLLLLYPIIIAPTVPNKPELAIFFIIASLSVIVWMLLLKKFGSSKNIGLSFITKIVLGAIFLGFYALGFLTFKSFGRNVSLIPESLPLLISFGIVLGIFYLIRKASKGYIERKIEYYNEFPIKIIPIIFFILFSLFFIFIPQNPFHTIIFVGGTILGTFCFIFCIIKIISNKTSF